MTTSAKTNAITTRTEDVRAVAAEAMAEVFHTGASLSGFYNVLTFNGVDVDVAASPGWGVHLVAHGPGASPREVRLQPADLTSVEDILDALAALMAA